MLLTISIPLATLNVVAFVLYGVDKRRAMTGGWRIPERTLLVWAVPGAVGALLGMHVFRHKTLKPKFRYGVPAILAAEVLVAFCLARMFFGLPV